MSRRLEEENTLTSTIVYGIGGVTSELFVQRVVYPYEFSPCHYWCLA